MTCFCSHDSVKPASYSFLEPMDSPLDRARIVVSLILDQSAEAVALKTSDLSAERAKLPSDALVCGAKAMAASMLSTRVSRLENETALRLLSPLARIRAFCIVHAHGPSIPVWPTKVPPSQPCWLK